jgi:hypothetical protein
MEGRHDGVRVIVHDRQSDDRGRFKIVFDNEQKHQAQFANSFDDLCRTIDAFFCTRVVSTEQVDKARLRDGRIGRGFDTTPPPVAKGWEG